MRGHDISGKRFYKQLNPVQSIRDAAKPLIFVFAVENERRPSVLHETFGSVVMIVKDTITLPFVLSRYRISPARAQDSPDFR